MSGREGMVYRLYEPGDEHGIVRLFREVFGREMSLDEWRWKYQGQGNRTVYASVAVHPDEGVVAHYGGVPIRIIYNGCDALSLAICDVMTTPKYRGIKTLRTVSSLVPEKAVKDGFILGYGFPNQRTLLLPALKLGLYEEVEGVWESTRVPEERSDFDRLYYKFFPLDYKDSRIDGLWNRFMGSVGLSAVRDRDYMKWRYSDHPIFTYELWGLRKRLSSSLDGLAVLRRDSTQLMITDILWTGGSLKPLIKKAETYAWRTGAESIRMWHPESLAAPMKQLGYASAHSGITIPRTTHPETLKKEDFQGRFFFTMGDTDFL